MARDWGSVALLEGWLLVRAQRIVDGIRVCVCSFVSQESAISGLFFTQIEVRIAGCGCLVVGLSQRNLLFELRREVACNYSVSIFCVEAVGTLYQPLTGRLRYLSTRMVLVIYVCANLGWNMKLS